MTSLVIRSTRQNLNIDTLERGIILALLLLRNAANAEGKEGSYFNAVRISTSVRQVQDETIAVLNASAKLPYQSNLALLGGMNLFRHLKTISSLNVAPSFRPLTPIVNAPPLPYEPPTIDTLEKYLFWATKILGASLYPTSNLVKINFFEEDPKEPSTLLEYALPLDWKIYLLSNNLLEASKMLVNNYIGDTLPDGTPIASNLLGNQTLMGNLSSLGN